MAPILKKSCPSMCYQLNRKNELKKLDSMRLGLDFDPGTYSAWVRSYLYTC